MKELYDIIINELYEDKSISALLYLLEGGRELSFRYENEEFSVTRDKERFYLNSQDSKKSQIYVDAWQLIEKGQVHGKKFMDIWKDIELLTLY
ncbi:MAG: hypothetical protein A2Y24_04415 [Clostridiales bacterium GWE2_32_10]|nr:MAG: hypothetical protein A2Y24_04415 [Clostridiales bacterium GWE2_32_10]